MSAWIHCNRCCAMGVNGGRFWLTSCGHITCESCQKTSSTGTMQGQKGPCVVCKKPETAIMQINRSMRPDILDMFRPPKDIIAECNRKVNTVIEFQATQSHRLIKQLNEKYKKAVDKIRIMEEEISKNTALERTLMEQRESLRAELERQKEHSDTLSSRLETTNRTMVNLLHSPSNTVFMASQGHPTPSFMVGRNAIRSKPIKPVVYASYIRTPNQFISPSASFISYRSPRPIMPGRITKGPVLPPQSPSIGSRHYRRY